MTLQYRRELEHLIEDLRANPRIRVIDTALGVGADPTRLAAFAEGMARRGLVVPQAMLDLYAQVDGFKLVWAPREGVKVPDGRRYLYPDGLRPWTYPDCYTEFFSFEALVERHDTVGWDLSGEAGEVTAAVHVLLDHDQEEQGTWLTCLGGAPRLFYVHNQGEDVDALGLDFEGFFQRFIAFRGFFCWQETFAAAPDRMALYEAWMPVLFPPA